MTSLWHPFALWLGCSPPWRAPTVRNRAVWGSVLAESGEGKRNPMRLAPDKKNPPVNQPERKETATPLGTLRLAFVPKLRPFGRVPTHIVGVVGDRRHHARAALNLPLRLKTVDGQPEPVPVTLLTRNISTTGAYFLAPRAISAGTPIELEVGLVDRPLGQGSVRMTTSAHVVRVETSETPGWHFLAVRFDDISFNRDDYLPQRYRS